MMVTFLDDRRWFITVHAWERMVEMGLDRVQVVDICDHSEVSYPPYQDTDRRIFIKGDFAVVTHPRDRVIITVLRNLPGWWPRVINS